MKTTLYAVAAIVVLVIAVVSGRSSSAQGKQDKYTLQIPGGLAFSEIRGYEQMLHLIGAGPSQYSCCRHSAHNPGTKHTPCWTRRTEGALLRYRLTSTGGLDGTAFWYGSYMD